MRDRYRSTNKFTLINKLNKWVAAATTAATAATTTTTIRKLSYIISILLFFKLFNCGHNNYIKHNKNGMQ